MSYAKSLLERKPQPRPINYNPRLSLRPRMLNEGIYHQHALNSYRAVNSQKQQKKYQEQ